LVLVVSFAAIGIAEHVDIGSLGQDVSVTVLESNDYRTVVRFDIGGFDKEAVSIDGQTYYQLRCQNEHVLLNASEPALPRLCRSIIIPDDAKMEINVISTEFVDIAETPVIPSKGDLLRTVNPDDVPYEFGPVYQSADWYPSELAAIREPFIMRDYRGTVIELNAFQYNPSEQSLRVFTSVTVEVVNTGPGEVNVFSDRGATIHLVPDFDMIYQQRFINYGMQSTRYPMVGEVGDLLIICYDGFTADMAPFVEWKLQKGIKTTMVNVSGIPNSSAAIESFIQSFYDSTELAFVLLVGDAAQVATPTASGGSSDPSYAKVAGTDDYLDILVGRFSAENSSQVQTQVERSLTYEKNPFLGDWFHKGTGVGSNQGPGHYGEYDNEHLDLIRDSLLSYTYTHVDQLYDPSVTIAMVSNALNNGRSFVNYTGHGSTTAWSSSGFSNTNVNALVNDNMLPFIVSVACVNGQFNGYTCFAEAWQRATNGGVPTGAIGSYMSSINQSWDPPMDAQDEITHLLINEVRSTYGGLCVNGSHRMIEVNGAGGVSMCDTWHIFGDPSLVVRTDTPAALSVNHAGAVFFYLSEYQVEVVGVEGALCALYHNGILYGSAYTSFDGIAHIPISMMMPVGQEMTLTVTAYNHETIQEGVMVTSDLAVIVPSPLQDTKDYENPYEPHCLIFSEDDLIADSLLLYYEINSTLYEDTLNLVREDGEFYGVIPAQAPGTTIDYYFFAVNTSGKADTTDVYTFRVIDYGLLLGPESSSQTAPVDDTLWYDLTVTNDGVLDDSYTLSLADDDWPTTIWDGAGSSQISATLTMIADETFDFKVRVIIPSSWEGESDELTVTATSVGNSSYSASVGITTVSAGQPWPIPFTESFLTTELDMYKWESGDGTEINETGMNEPSPPYSINFDGTPDGGDELISESINLRGETSVIVKYKYQQTGGGDSPEAADDLTVAYLDSNGMWHNLVIHLGADPDMTEFEQAEHQLPNDAYHAGFRIRFTNTATTGNYDDWFVDNIYVGHPPSYQAMLTPGIQEQYGPADDTATFSVYVHNQGLYDDSFTLEDSLGTWDVSFWDALNTTQITSVGPVSPADSATFLVKVNIPASAPLNSRDTAMVKARSTGDPDIVAAAFVTSISAGAPVAVPWYEPFPSASIDMSRWMTNDGASTASNALGTPSPPYSLLIDGGDLLVSQLIDISGHDAALFMYDFERTGPGAAPESGDDLVFEYKNSSGVWTELSRQYGSGIDMTEFEAVQIPLPSDALYGSFQFRISGSGDSSDDWYIDDIRIDFAPSISVLPTTLDFNLGPDESAESEIIIANGGPGTLSYSVQAVPVFDKMSAFGNALFLGNVEPASRPYPEGYFDEFIDVKGADDYGRGYEVRYNAGGPDTYGYIWVDSDEPGGPAFNWMDIQTTGIEVPIREDSLGDDSFVGPLPIGFAFNYYGVAYNEFYIASNGFIGFGPTDGYQRRQNTILPDGAAPDNIIAWCWKDLNPCDENNQTCQVFYESDGNRLVIQFVDYPEYEAAPGDVINAEVILYASGRIKCQYLSIAPGFNVTNSTTGIENVAGDDGLTVVFEADYLKSSLAVEFSAPAQWMAIMPTEGEIPSEGADTLLASVNTTGLEKGDYACAINVYSNDPDEEENPWSIPVSLNIADEPQYVCGDADGSTEVDIDDVVFLISYIFSGGPPPDPLEAGNADCLGETDIDDVTYIIAFIFTGGPEPCADCP
jgi:hypothetical protein